MINLVRAELQRLTRSTWLLAAISVVACIGWAIVQVVVFMTPETANERSVNAAYSMAQQGYMFVMIIGIIVVTSEYRHRTITWALLVTPRRGHVITAKLLASSLIGFVLGVAAAAVTTPAVAILLSGYEYPVWTPDVPGVLLGSIVSVALWCLLGAAVGALIRNMVAAITIAFVWVFYIEWALVMMVPDVGRWTPTGVAKAVSGWTRDGLSSFATGDLLPVWAGGLLMIGYAVTAAVAARLISVRRDVT
ncbi:ABC transporter permease subunit [Kibdelosporangium aridum]|uniref:ABC-2 family transporter protein n=1 Tax=Kibdelosporangium aridum TaxID=2030 RepID=A0A1Y5WXX5_KIBAR|nr:ABC transporter permease subunit [Kibdelosporangium aridum]SMC58715.1 ABC-2 family transporter protein [Kibdelosporangium aridum]